MATTVLKFNKQGSINKTFNITTESGSSAVLSDLDFYYCVADLVPVNIGKLSTFGSEKIVNLPDTYSDTFKLFFKYANGNDLHNSTSNNGGITLKGGGLSGTYTSKYIDGYFYFYNGSTSYNSTTSTTSTAYTITETSYTVLPIPVEGLENCTHSPEKLDKFITPSILTLTPLEGFEFSTVPTLVLQRASGYGTLSKNFTLTEDGTAT